MCTGNSHSSQSKSDSARQERRIWGTTKGNSNPTRPGGSHLIYSKGKIWNPGEEAVEWNFNY